MHFGRAKGKQGSIPPELRPIVENLHLETERWVETVARYGGLFHRVAGSAGSLGRKAVAMGQQDDDAKPSNFCACAFAGFCVFCSRQSDIDGERGSWPKARECGLTGDGRGSIQPRKRNITGDNGDKRG